ncbi:MAG: hypothetical protein KA067_01715 [Prevotella sp.]|nr:hypothetical protein [Prevotella sp.]
MRRGITILALLLLLCASALAQGRRYDKQLLQRVYRYASTIDTTDITGTHTYSYSRFLFRVDRKNPTLLLVPTVYAIAHSGQREYTGETYSRVDFRSLHQSESMPLLRVTTVPHRRAAMSALMRFMKPRVYDKTIIEGFIMSPFHRSNRKFYSYRTTFMLDGSVRISFTPKRKNIQLVSGEAFVDYYSGRILKCSINGEYDMVNFSLNIRLGEEGSWSLMPVKCELNSRFGFLGSKVSGRLLGYLGLPQMLTDSVTHEDDMQKMHHVRPEKLDSAESMLYEQALREKIRRDSLAEATAHLPEKRNWVKEILWDAIGDKMLNRMKTTFGTQNQGYIRVNPILNPFYMSYSHNRGFTYKFDVRTQYRIGDNQEFSLRFKSGYAFRQKQFYFRMPIYFYYNKNRNGYLKVEIGNGNHIKSKSVRSDIEQELPDTTGMHLPDFDLLNEFKQTDTRMVFNYDLSPKFSIQLGALYQHRQAVNIHAFHALGWRSSYRSFSPLIEIEYRPWAWQGPIFTLDYDRGIKGMLNSNTGYERWELNGEYIHQINKLQSLQMRVGTGFYTRREHDAYFLTYENFQENNIPDGWNDDWSGEFQLLRSDTYNTSEYYVRANVTYESPMLLLSWLPWVGHYMEMERIYASALDVKGIHPYVEFGYDFTTRLMSVGAFVSTGQGNRTFGIKFGFELFSHW